MGESLKNLSIGFDLGVASIGWSVYDMDDEKLIDYGVKLFEQSDKAEDRRKARGLRRRYKRQYHRLERFNWLLKNYNISYQNTLDNNLLSKRIKGLKEEISQQDILNILRFFLQYRGYNPVGNDTRENIYKDKYPNLYAAEIQQIIKNETGSYRGLDFPFLIEDFTKEIQQILNTQKKYHNFLDDNFIKKYIEILESRREFWEGPGGPKENQLTPFGRYKNKEDLLKYSKNKDYNKYLYENLIKDCSVYRGEKAVPVYNYYAQRFNFLNDMINIRIPKTKLDGKLDKLEKVIEKDKDNYKLKLDTINEIQEKILSNSSVKFDSIFESILGLKTEDMSGYRISTKGKPEITKFVEYKKALKATKEIKTSMNLKENIDLWNELVYYGTVVPAGNLKAILQEKFPHLSLDEIQIIQNLELKGQYHSFSEKALVKYIELMENQLENSSTIERKYPEEIKSDIHDYLINNYFEGTNSLKMSKKYIDDLVASPQVKKTLRKSITTFNQIKQKYSINNGYGIKYVVIESNKELLPSKKQKEYQINQSGNETKRTEAKKKWEKDNKGYDNPEKYIEKYILLEESNHKCIYCDANITIENMEIEHILPISQTADDSFANKSASCRKCNGDKKDKTPYQYLGSSNWNEFVDRVSNIKEITSEKLKNLLFTENINKYEKKFLNRNLRDTAYITKEFTKQLNLYKEAVEKVKNLEVQFNIISMPPKITGLIRNHTPKDRNNKYHHAFDASIAAMYPTTKFGKMSDLIQNDPAAYWQGEKYEKFLSNDFKKFRYPDELHNQLLSIDYTNTKFHFEIKKSINGQLCNADINKVIIKESTKKKKEHLKIEYISSIYSDEKKDIDKIKKLLEIEKSFSQNLAIKNQDNDTFKWLQNIFREYEGKKWKDEEGKEQGKEMNPFKYYACELHNLDNPSQFIINKHGLRPISKKGKQRPIINRLNYAVKVSKPYLLEKEGSKKIDIDTQKIQKKKNNYIMLDSIKTVYVKIYKNLDNGKYIFFPMISMFFDLNTQKLRKDYKDMPYYIKLYNELIGESNIEFVMDVRNGEYLRVQKAKGNIVEGCYSTYDKSGKNLELRKSSTYKSTPKLVASDVKIEKIPIYGLGIPNVCVPE